MGNTAIQDNVIAAPNADLAISVRGSDWYYTVTAIMGASTLAVMGLSLMKPRTHRLFHYISAILLFVASIAYYSMGSGLGQTPVLAEFMRKSSSEVAAAGTREIFYARYIDWAVTTPLLLLDLLLTAGLPWPTIITTILADEIMIVTGLLGALTPTAYKWGYWVFGMFAFFYVVYVLVFEGRRNAGLLGSHIQKAYTQCGVLTIFLWFLYPVAWGVAEGGNVIHPDSEAIFYGVLDIFAKPGFTFLLLWGHHSIEPAELGLHPGVKSAAHEKGVFPNGDHASTSTATPA